jgi:hypothetical protein
MLFATSISVLEPCKTMSPDPSCLRLLLICSPHVLPRATCCIDNSERMRHGGKDNGANVGQGFLQRLWQSHFSAHLVRKLLDHGILSQEGQTFPSCESVFLAGSCAASKSGSTQEGGANFCIVAGCGRAGGWLA